MFGLGAVSAAAAMSHYDDALGGLVYASAQTRIRSVTLEASAQRTFGDYQDIASTSTSQSYLLRLATLGALSGTSLASFLSADVPRSVDPGVDRLSPAVPQSSLSASFANVAPVGSRFDPRARRLLVEEFRLSAARFRPRSTRVRGATTLDRRLCRASACRSDRSATARSAASPTTASIRRRSASIQPLDQQPGSVGWRIQDQEGVQFNRTRRGLLSVLLGVLTGRINQSNGELDGSAQMDGGLAVTRDGVFASNRIDDAFGVVKAGAPNVDVYVENQKVGHTDSHGTLLVPNLRSFELEPGRHRSRQPADRRLARAHRGDRDAAEPERRCGSISASMPGSTPPNSPGRRSRRAAEGGPAGRLSNGAEFIVGFDGLAFVTGLRTSRRLEIDGEHGACRASFSYRRPRASGSDRADRLPVSEGALARS